MTADAAVLGIPVADALSVVASAVFLVRLLPQPLRLWRSGVAEGVSPMSAYNAVLSAVAWTLYGLAQGLFVVWFVSLLALVPGVWQAVLLLRRTTPTDAAGAVVWGGVVVAGAATGTLGPVLALSVLVTSGPQVWESLRDRDLSGIAPTTWRISLADAALWGAYGLAIDDAALLGYWAVLTACALVVLARIAWTRRRGWTHHLHGSGGTAGQDRVHRDRVHADGPRRTVGAVQPAPHEPSEAS